MLTDTYTYMHKHRETHTYTHKHREMPSQTQRKACIHTCTLTKTHTQIKTYTRALPFVANRETTCLWSCKNANFVALWHHESVSVQLCASVKCQGVCVCMLDSTWHVGCSASCLMLGFHSMSSWILHRYLSWRCPDWVGTVPRTGLGASLGGAAEPLGGGWGSGCPGGTGGSVTWCCQHCCPDSHSQSWWNPRHWSILQNTR